MKTCTLCKKEKTLDSFYKHSGFSDGYRSRCKSCHNSKSREWQLNNLDKVNALYRKYYKQDPEKHKARTLKWMKENPEEVCNLSHKYRARKKDAFVEDVHPLVVLELDDGICGICGKDVNPFDFHIDHIYPLAKGGEHMYHNVQLAHPECNAKKGVKVS